MALNWPFNSSNVQAEFEDNITHRMNTMYNRIFGSGSWGSGAFLSDFDGTGQPSGSNVQATNVTHDSATLNGTVNTGGLTTTYYFEYDTDSSFSTPAEVGTGTTSNNGANVSEDLSGLSTGTTYYFRLVTYNGFNNQSDSDYNYTASESFTPELQDLNNPTNVNASGTFGPDLTFTVTANVDGNADSNEILVRDADDPNSSWYHDGNATKSELEGGGYQGVWTLGEGFGPNIDSVDIGVRSIGTGYNDTPVIFDTINR